MDSNNKWNLKRLLNLFAAVIIAFLALVTLKVSFNWWWASLPTASAALACAGMIFWHGFVKPDLED